MIQITLFEIVQGNTMRSCRLPDLRAQRVYLEPLKDMPLKDLDLHNNTPVLDLKILKGIPPTSLWLGNCREIRDRSQRSSMPCEATPQKIGTVPPLREKTTSEG
jgi:hypothetical protein